MKPWQKLVLILGGSAVLSVGVLGLLGYHFMWKKKDQIIAATIEAGQRGEAFGRGKPKAACVDEAMRRLEIERGIIEEPLIRLALKTCLGVAQADDTCDGVPPPSELMRAGAWAMARCHGREMSLDQSCVRTMGAVAEHCSTQ